MQLIDLHVHSTISDGTLSPQELAHYAKEKGLKAIALTDHDTVDGVKACIAQGEALGVTVIPGIECSADYFGKELHILGYFIDPDHQPLKDKLATLVEGRKRRNLLMLERLNALGITLTMEDLLEGCAPNTILTRAHFAAAMLRKGYITERDKAFSKYLGQGKPAFVPKEEVTVKSCIDMIHDAGGLAVLAHPMLYGYNRSEITQIITSLVKDGLDGIECVYSTHLDHDTAHLLQVCSNLKLFPTGGSDFHGANKPNLDLGCGYGKLQVPFSYLEAMIALWQQLQS